MGTLQARQGGLACAPTYSAAIMRRWNGSYYYYTEITAPTRRVKGKHAHARMQARGGGCLPQPRRWLCIASLRFRFSFAACLCVLGCSLALVVCVRPPRPPVAGSAAAYVRMCSSRETAKKKIRAERQPGSLAMHGLWMGTVRGLIYRPVRVKGTMKRS
jgi:hypothetical protein